MRKFGLMLVASLPSIAAAQQAPVPAPAATGAAAQTGVEAGEAEEPGEADEIVITGSRKLPGSVVGDIPPDQTDRKSVV